jgi:hypothetical protein
LNRFLNYRRDPSIPKHRLNWNWVADLPFGKGKHWGRNANRAVDALIGGWQVGGNGEWFSRYFTLGAGNWGSLGTVQLNDRNVPVKDCRSGVCFDGWLYYNGYIPANRINSTAANGQPNGVMGVPSSYQPSSQPVWPTPATPNPNDPNARFYETNTVFVRLANGALQQTSVNTNLHPWRNQFLPAPWVFALNSSLFKSVRINESLVARLNVDFFGVLNNPGLPLPDSTSGILLTRFSNNTPRNLQLTLRLTW